MVQVVKMESCAAECAKKASMGGEHLSRNGNAKGSVCKEA